MEDDLVVFDWVVQSYWLDGRPYNRLPLVNPVSNLLWEKKNFIGKNKFH